MSDLKLFMILIGYRPKGFNTEQHDVIFLPGTSMNDPEFLKKITSSYTAAQLCAGAYRYLCGGHAGRWSHRFSGHRPTSSTPVKTKNYTMSIWVVTKRGYFRAS
jgi:hypothetical protein